MALLQLPEYRDLAALAAAACYVFAAGRIADYLISSGKGITKREVLLAPFAYLIFAAAAALSYFASPLSTPPQNTIITKAAYLALLPCALAILSGSVALWLFFRGRLSGLQSLDLSAHVLLAPIFDGLAGYGAAMGAASLLVLASAASFWSSGGNFSLVTLDFLILSAVFSLYFLYRALAAKNNEGRAAGFVSMLLMLAPGVLRLYFRDIACALLALVPIKFFQSCPLLQSGDEVTLALSVLATLVLLAPIIPFIYAVSVNLLRALVALSVLAGKEGGKPKAI